MSVWAGFWLAVCAIELGMAAVALVRAHRSDSAALAAGWIAVCAMFFTAAVAASGVNQQRAIDALESRLDSIATVSVGQ